MAGLFRRLMIFREVTSSWGIHLNVLISSDDVDTSKAPDAEGQERLGTIDVEWRF